MELEKGKGPFFKRGHLFRKGLTGHFSLKGKGALVKVKGHLSDFNRAIIRGEGGISRTRKGAITRNIEGHI